MAAELQTAVIAASGGVIAATAISEAARRLPQLAPYREVLPVAGIVLGAVLVQARDSGARTFAGGVITASVMALVDALLNRFGYNPY